MDELTVRRGQVRLAVRTFGKRGKNLLLLHGLASSQHIWDLVIPALERSFRVTTYDQRGHGVSSKPASGYGFDAMTADLGRVMEVVGARRPILVGHSWGANVCIDYAARHPNRVAGLFSVDGGMGSISEIWEWSQAREVLAPPQLRGMHIDELMAMARSEVPKRSWSPKIEEMVRTLFVIDSRGRIRPRLSRANHMRILRALYDQRPKELMGRLRCPTLMFCARPRAHVMEGERAFYEMKKRSAAEIRRVNPRIRIEWITSIHDIPLDRPRELADRLARFTLKEAWAR